MQLLPRVRLEVSREVENELYDLLPFSSGDELSVFP